MRTLYRFPFAGSRGAPIGPLLAIVLAGCKSIGPSTVPRDRFEYSHSIADSWKRQTLLNIVKLRYLDPPIFVDVGQIVAGYSLETALTAGASLPEGDALGGNTFALGGSSRFTDRPTVTYTPLTGSKFIKGLITPLPPDAIFFTILSGWPADSVIMATIAAINGVKNESATISDVAMAEPKFLRVAQLMRKIQISGAAAMRVLQDPQKRQTTLLTFHSKEMSEQTDADIRELRELLGLSQDAEEFEVVFGSGPTSDRELAVVSRSILHIMSALAVEVDVPAKHLEEGRATPGHTAAGDASDSQRQVRIHASESRPDDAFVAVPYRGHWFWIDDCDLQTKRAFSFVMFLFTLAETGERDALPLITIPAQ